MSRIFKYPFDVGANVEFDLPQGAELLHVGLDPQGVSCLWARVHPGMPTEKHYLHVYGTGMVIPDGLTHFGTFVQEEYVRHVFIK
jgi:hypothetical protein